jgi:uncharacterized membrane protein (UPF0127 family)
VNARSADSVWRLLAHVATERGLRWLGIGIWVLLALGLAACIDNGADGPEDPSLQDSSRVPGFAEVGFEVENAEGHAADYCALLADTEQARGQGMIGRSDFAGYDGMVFTYDAEVTNGYHMRGVPIPLAIAWFDAQGKFVSSAEMQECPEGTGACASRTYLATGPFRYALEAPAGGLSQLGIGPGASISVGGSCGGG